MALLKSLVNSVRFDKAGGGDQHINSTRQSFEFGFHPDLTAIGRGFDRRSRSRLPPGARKTPKEEAGRCGQLSLGFVPVTPSAIIEAGATIRDINGRIVHRTRNGY
jgi:hypothetical protein